MLLLRLAGLAVALLFKSSEAKLSSHYNQFNVASWKDVNKPLSSAPSQDFFTQYIDHGNPAIGTFQQKYLWSTEYWGGAGYPIILFAGEERLLDEKSDIVLFTNHRLSGEIAQSVRAAVIAIKHRYYGESSPFNNLTTKNLQYLTVEQNIHDMVNFARTASLPFDTANKSTAVQVPWVLMGGSYAGASTAWTASTAPDTFWAYHASSAVVETIDDFWGLSVDIQEHAAQDCSALLTRIAQHFDEVFALANETEKYNVKAMFGMENVKHDDDFAFALANRLRHYWQEQQLSSDYGWSDLCDYLEAPPATFPASHTLPTTSGVSLDTALNRCATLWRTELLPDFCRRNYRYDVLNSTSNTACFDTYNALSSIFTDASVANGVERRWVWLRCNEPLGWTMTATPQGLPSIASRLLTPDYFRRQCALYFPEETDSASNRTYTSGGAAGKMESQFNNHIHGWDVESVASDTRVFFVNGQYDPWRGATVSSENRPGGMLADAPALNRRVALIPGGHHCSDMYMINTILNDDVRAVVDEEIRQLKVWLAEWPHVVRGSGSGRRGATATTTQSATWTTITTT